MLIPLNQRLGLSKVELNRLQTALTIMKNAIALAPRSHTKELGQLLDKACDARNALDAVIHMETGVKP